MTGNNEVSWFKNGRLIEPIFVDEFKEQYISVYNSDIVCYNDEFYDVNGKVAITHLKREIMEILSQYLNQQVAKYVDTVIGLMKIKYWVNSIDIDEDVVLFENCNYNVKAKRASTKYNICKSRLPVKYDDTASTPTKWLNFLSELLYDDDIKTLQQFLGYCLIPSTKAQAMLYIVGNGGEGKSVITSVVSALFGAFGTRNSLHNITTDRFGCAGLEDKLIMIEDDANFDGIRQTGTLKNLITGTVPVNIEHKYKESYNVYLYCRLLVISNTAIKSLYDNSNGFWRRINIVETRPKNKGRKDNRYLASEIIESELCGIANWCLAGLHKLIENNFELYKSPRTKRNIQYARESSDNIQAFLSSDYVYYDKNSSASVSSLHHSYKKWCDDNAEEPRALATFGRSLKNYTSQYEIQYTDNVTADGKRKRGYSGIGVF